MANLNPLAEAATPYLIRGNPGSNYFPFPDGLSNSLAPKFKNDFNKY